MSSHHVALLKTSRIRSRPCLVAAPPTRKAEWRCRQETHHLHGRTAYAEVVQFQLCGAFCCLLCNALPKGMAFSLRFGDASLALCAEGALGLYQFCLRCILRSLWPAASRPFEVDIPIFRSARMERAFCSSAICLSMLQEFLQSLSLLVEIIQV